MTAASGRGPGPEPGGPEPGVATGDRGVTLGVRSAASGRYLEAFLVSAVAAVLLIRILLAIANYPQLGGRGLHIAHMLWGGLFMVVAIALLLSVLGERAKRGAAILGGVGFGTFIDELGKFITSDNNYFYQPTIALLYLIFVLMYVAFRYLDPRGDLSPRAEVANAADVLMNGLIGGATSEDLFRGLYFLKRSGARGPEVDAIRQALLALSSHVKTGLAPAPPIVVLGRRALDRLLGWTWFHHTVIAVFVAHAGVFVLATLVAAALLAPAQILGSGSRSGAAIGSVVASVIVALLTVVGAISLRSDRLAAYIWFKRAILVSILLVQVFFFYEHQFGALGGLALDLIILVGLNELMDKERLTSRTAFVDTTGAG